MPGRGGPATLEQGSYLGQSLARPARLPLTLTNTSGGRLFHEVRRVLCLQMPGLVQMADGVLRMPVNTG